tara:strand:- start:1890 stop:2495 length:606 start_codon:yes stop_codon:yes gene_type:complete
MAGAIDKFKANLSGGGARANQFRVIFNTPIVGRGLTGELGEKASYLCRAASLPGQTINTIEIPYRGRKIYIAGDRDFPDDWTTTVLNDTAFTVRSAIENWMNNINDLVNGRGINNPLHYETDLTVHQLDRSNGILKSYKIHNAFPTGTNAIDLTSDQADAIEEFEITWRYQYFTISDVGDGIEDKGYDWWPTTPNHGTVGD